MTHSTERPSEHPATRVLLTWQSDAFGGVEKRMLDEVRVLREIGWDVNVAAPRFAQDTTWRQQLSDAGARLLQWNPYKFIERQHLAWPVPALSGLSGRLLASHRFDLAVLPLTWTTVGMSRLYALHRAGIPSVLSFRCTYPDARFSDRLQTYLRRALSSVVGGYGVSATATESFVANFDRLLPRLDFVTIHNGVDTDAFASDAHQRSHLRHELGIAEHEFVVIFCARLDPMKRPALALRAFAHLYAQKSDSRLLMLGEGRLRADLESLARVLGVHDRVVFTGFRTDTARWFAAADLYLSTSEANEGFPNAASEALACALPSVLPDDRIHRGLFGACQAVRLCEGQDAERWGQALVDAAACPSAIREARSHSAREFAKRHLDVVAMRSALSDFYWNIAARLPKRN